MENMSILKFREEISLHQKKIQLIELISEGSKYNGYESPYQMDKKHALDFELKKNGLLFILDEILEDLVKVDFIIDLDTCRMMKEIEESTTSEFIDDPNNMNLLKAKQLRGVVLDAYSYISRIKEVKEINVLDMLVENKKVELITELIISNKVKLSQKYHLLEKIIIDFPSLLKLIYNKPTLFSYTEEYSEGEQLFKEKLEQNLHNIFIDEEKSIGIVRTVFKREFKDETAKYNNINAMEFFIDNNLVDINKINWKYDNCFEINFAAACFIRGYERLGKSVYSREDYKKNDKKVRDDSDKIIFDKMSDNLRYSRSVNNLIEIIENPNFESSPEKFDYLINILLKEYMTNPTVEFKKSIDIVVNKLLRKTKKEDYKKIIEAIENLNINLDNDKLNQGRKKLVQILGKVDNVLMEQIPPRKLIKDIKFVKKIDN